MVKILKLSEILDKILYEQIIEQVNNIFFLSSSIREFSSLEKKNVFFKRWCGDYITYYPEQFYILKEEEKVLGYICSCNDSKKAQSQLEVPAYDLFFDQFDKYPAHFHINFHPDCRGRGLGGNLVEELSLELKSKGFSGVHIVTSPGALNVSFYKKHGFSYELIRNFNKNPLLFMGKMLT